MKLQFDDELKKWMNELISFLDYVCRARLTYWKLDILDELGYEYLTLADSVTSQLFYFIMNEELSNSSGNFALEELCKYISLDSNDNTIDEAIFRRNLQYMSELAINQFNTYFQGQLYDYYVSMWSCFEYSISNIFSRIEDRVQKQLEEKQIDKIKKMLRTKILCTINCEDKVKNQIIEEVDKNSDYFIKNFPKYISFSDKINYLFKSDLLKEYSRNIKKDKSILLYCAALRNTLHNNGEHKKADIEVKIKGHTFELKKDTKIYFENYKDIMILIREIFNIYLEIITKVYENSL